MKITSLIAALVATAALTALGQEGVVQDVKHGAKKAGETIKDGVETVGEKTKETAKTVGKKTKETAETVGEKTKETGETVVRKTKETVDGTGEKASGTTQKTHHKSSKSASKAKAQTTEEQTTDRRLKYAGTKPDDPDSKSAVVVATTVQHPVMLRFPTCSASLFTQIACCAQMVGSARCADRTPQRGVPTVVSPHC